MNRAAAAMAELSSQQDALVVMVSDVMGAWCDGVRQFERATSGTVQALGYPQQEVRRQLGRIGEAFADAAAVRAALAAELAVDATPPRCIVHVAGAAVPGLILESTLWGVLTGARNLVRVPRGDATLAAWLDLARERAPMLAQRVALVDDAAWLNAAGASDIDAAIVHGTDATIAFVTQRLSPHAMVAGFGAREAIALVTPRGAAAHEHWAEQLANDVLTFDGAGCMCPRTIVWLAEQPSAGGGELPNAAALTEQFDGTLRSALDRRLKAPIESVAERARNDERAFALIEPPVTYQSLRSEQQLVQALAARRSTLQTAVLCAAADEREQLAQLLLSAGCTRVCEPGAANLPDPLAPHEARGRVRPLLRAAVSLPARS